jgi:CHAT domain-containing protein
MKDDATEEKVKSLHAEVLHIATHGFFLADLSDVEGDKILGMETSTAKKNPLLRSGLLLANCEKVFDETGEKGNTNNGILTAYEVMNLSLEGTDLVVMSACQTGLGDIKSGEGVYGLQRSFLVAGAKSVIMSLWEVSDDATMELMTEFYKNYSTTGNKQDAFLAAEKKIKLKYKEPFDWGAFVLSGN